MEKKIKKLEDRLDRVAGRADVLGYVVTALIGACPDAVAAAVLKELPQLEQALESGLKQAQASQQYLNGQRDVFALIPTSSQKLGSLPWLAQDA